MWWLSVDMAYYQCLDLYAEGISQEEKRKRIIEMIKLHSGIFQQDIVHLVQSEYAYDHCKYIGIPQNSIKFLGDYLRDEFLDNALRPCEIQKQNMVTYNPKKGMEFTKKIISLAPEIEWVPLIGLSTEEMSLLLKSAKVYIDFGDHPGMDRIPRGSYQWLLCYYW